LWRRSASYLAFSAAARRDLFPCLCLSTLRRYNKISVCSGVGTGRVWLKLTLAALRAFMAERGWQAACLPGALPHHRLAGGTILYALPPPTGIYLPSGIAATCRQAVGTGCALRSPLDIRDGTDGGSPFQTMSSIVVVSQRSEEFRWIATDVRTNSSLRQRTAPSTKRNTTCNNLYQAIHAPRLAAVYSDMGDCYAQLPGLLLTPRLAISRLYGRQHSVALAPLILRLGVFRRCSAYSSTLCCHPAHLHRPSACTISTCLLLSLPPYALVLPAFYRLRLDVAFSRRVPFTRFARLSGLFVWALLDGKARAGRKKKKKKKNIVAVGFCCVQFVDVSSSYLVPTCPTHYPLP